MKTWAVCNTKTSLLPGKGMCVSVCVCVCVCMAVGRGWEEFEFLHGVQKVAYDGRRV